MKKIACLLTLVPVALLSCKKENSSIKPKPEEKLYEVNFKISDFSQKILPIGLEASSDLQKGKHIQNDEQIGWIDFFVLDRENNLVFKEKRPRIDADKKEIPGVDEFKFILPKGKYKFGIIGGETWIELYHENYPNYILNTLFTNFINKSIVEYDESFYKEITDFTVGKDTTFAPIKLKRLNGRFQLKITDKIPEEVKYLLIGGDLPDMITPFGPLLTKYYAKHYFKFDVAKYSGKRGILFTTNMYSKNFGNGNEKELDLDVYIYDNQDKLLGINKIKKVQFKPNHITTVTGNIFDGLKDGESSTKLKVEYIKEFAKEELNYKF